MFINNFINQRVKITDEIFVDNVTYEDVCNYVDKILLNSSDKKPHLIFAQNPLKVAMASKNQALMNSLKFADVLIPDGVGIIIAARLKKIKIKQRVTGVDLMYRLISLANNKGYSVFFLGGKPGVAEQAINNLKRKFPYLKVVGCSDGYFSKESINSVIERINNNSPDILFVCMGSPLQEIFLHSNKPEIKVPICMGGGGSLDIYAGNIKRAPVVIQKIGFEWLHRLIKEPKRIKRFYSGYFSFFALIFDRLILKNNRS